MDNILKASLPKLREKLLEALQAVLPIVAIVLVLCFTIAPISPSILLCFLLGAAMIIVGIMFFTLGAEMSMSPMGERVGAMLTKSRSVPLIIGVGFLLGFLITISEPDLQVLANQVPSIPNMTLILSVAAGVGLFLVVAFLRMLLGIALPKLLVVFYGLIFVLAAFVPKEFLSVAFDSGGVTTGPITVPFIMALGVGVAAIRSDMPRTTALVWWRSAPSAPFWRCSFWALRSRPATAPTFRPSCPTSAIPWSCGSSSTRACPPTSRRSPPPCCPSSPCSACSSWRPSSSTGGRWAASAWA